MNGDLNGLLATFGFNNLEAEVYIDLLKNHASTGYAIGKRLGKATANVYKALDVLANQGAVIFTENEKNRLYEAVSIQEFAHQLEHSFQHRKQALVEQLQVIDQRSEADNRIFQLSSVSLVFEKARQMLQRCQSIAVIDAFPKPAKMLASEIEAAVSRGVNVILQVYEPIDINGVEPTLIHMAKENLDLWQSQQLNIVADAQESLVALFEANMVEVFQAHWSQSVYLSFILHVGMIRENNSHVLLTMANSPNFYKDAHKILALDERFSPTAVPGMATMFHRYGLGDIKEIK